MHKRTTILSLVLAFSLLVLSACSAVSAGLGQAAATLGNSPQASLPKAAAAAPAASNAPDLLAAYQGTLEDIYTAVSPSVVNIRVVQSVQNTAGVDPQAPGFPFFNLPQGQQPPQQFQSGLGSGFVLDQAGHIVTNNHVVADADKIEVTFSDGTILPAALVGADPDSDLAVIKVEAPAALLKPVQFGDSSALKVGQLAVAIGNPFGLEGTMTAGIVSALGRSLPVESSGGPSYTIPDIIQTDAPINPGNSGGVLVDAQGQVIGVTSAIESPVRANAGIGFAIPAAIVQNVVPSLVKDGHFDHPWLGISGSGLVPEVAKAMKLPEGQRGVLVNEVMPNSPAEKAGLRGSSQQAGIEGQQVPVGGDVITAIDGQPLQGVDELIAYLARSTSVGQKVSLQILRDGKQQTLEATLAARPGVDERSLAQASAGVRLGITGLDLNPQVAAAMKLAETQAGVLVMQVEAGGIAEEIGLRGGDQPLTLQGQEVTVGGDIITAINGQSVTSIQELRAALASLSQGDKLTLTILRNGAQVELSLTIG